ncbi:hypothetical protein ACF1AE_21685 [Streptomyces sp. NPDC014986]|uniref:hypothetical protein n=1 Tax=Streptomyces sp. NPDC014986 TaxID=3364934 RepID=UPI0036F7E770
MARDIGVAPDAELFRAVITKHYGDGTVETVYEGPYDKPGPARGRVSFWRGHLAKREDGSSAEGHIESCRPVWSKVADPASQPGRPTACDQGEATPADGPVARLVTEALRTRRGMHGRHVADLLAEHGHTEEADRVRTEVRARNGHLSGKQALELLRTAP